MAVVIALYAILFGGSVGEINSRQSTWCSAQPLPPGMTVGQSREDVQFTIVSRTELGRAMQRLSRRSVVALDARGFRRLARGGVSPAPGKYLYLTRAGVMTPVELPEGDFPAYAERAGYSASVTLPRDVLIVASLMTSGSRQSPRNYAILLSSSTPVAGVRVGCLGGR